MGLGGYQAARTDAEHYASELAREERETREVPRVEVEEVVKSRGTGVPALRGGVQTLVTGGLAAAAAFGIARLLG